MKSRNGRNERKHIWAAVALAAVLVPAGCRQTATVDDPTLTSNVQGRIQADSAISTEPIQVSTAAGVVTLNGQVSNSAARSLAANDAAGITGVKKVINNIVVAANTPPVSATVTTPQPSVAPQSAPPIRERVQARQLPPPARTERASAPVDRASAAPVERPAPPPQPVTPPAPPAPTFRNVTLAAGTVLPVRITQTLDSATTQTGDTFNGSIATDIVQDGLVVLPRGTGVSGRVTDAKDATHFTGSSRLAVELTAINRKGQAIAVSTQPFSKEGAARGKNTAVKTGVGAAAGAVLGGIFGGGKGAAIGAAAGGGTGAGVNAVTRGQQVQIPSETVVRFETTNSITVRTSTSHESTSNGNGPAFGGDSRNGSDTGLQNRN